MVDTVTTKGITVSAATVARQGYWRGVFRRLLRDPGGVFVGAIILILLALALFGFTTFRHYSGRHPAVAVYGDCPGGVRLFHRRGDRHYRRLCGR